MQKTVLFHRVYKGFTGGHLKVSHYFRHTLEAKGFAASIYLTPDSLENHLWQDVETVVSHYDPLSADILFVAGFDWQALDEYPEIEERIPVINLIQGLRHADVGTPLYGFLKRKAIRICVSPEVQVAIEATGRCNGPIHTICNGIDFSAQPPPNTLTDEEVFIVGIKDVPFAKALAKRLSEREISVDLLMFPVSRSEFLARMGAARIVCFLPFDKEGFYMPALEAMALGRLVICPDCGGNRSFCIDSATALVPQRTLDAMEEAVLKAMQMPSLATALSTAGKAISARFSMQIERDAYLDVLHGIEQ